MALQSHPKGLGCYASLSFPPLASKQERYQKEFFQTRHMTNTACFYHAGAVTKGNDNCQLRYDIKSCAM